MQQALMLSGVVQGQPPLYDQRDAAMSSLLLETHQCAEAVCLNLHSISEAVA